MSLFDVNTQDRIAVVTLKNGVTNPINLKFVSEFSEFLDTASNDFFAMVLTGNEKFFSIGLDLPVLMKFDRPELLNFFSQFQEMLLKLATLPIPVVCAITGHAVGAGKTLLVCGDFRVTKSGKHKIGLNESQLGVPVPYFADLMLRHVVGSRISRRLLIEGRLLDVEEAKNIGLIDEVYPDALVLEHAIEQASYLSKVPANAFAEIKMNQLDDIRDRYHSRKKVKMEKFLDLWFSEEAQSRLKAALKKF